MVSKAASLTPAVTEMLAHLLAGFSNKLIALALNKAEATVSTRLHQGYGETSPPSSRRGVASSRQARSVRWSGSAAPTGFVALRARICENRASPAAPG